MHLIDPTGRSRRAFLSRCGQLALAGSAMPLALNLAAMGEAAAQAAPGDDYKALVCVFLYGGNDYANTLVAFDDDSYARYSRIRGGDGEAGGGIALARAALLPTVLAPAQALADGRQYALHPAMAELAELFNRDGTLAVQLNVGPLIQPLSRAEYHHPDRSRYRLPPKLFSHNDQQSFWQACAAEGAATGWGGGLGDLAMSGSPASLFTCMSVAGNAVFLAGEQALPFQVGSGGAVRIVGVNHQRNHLFGSTVAKAAMRQLVLEPRAHLLEEEYSRIARRAVQTEARITAAIADALPADAFPADNPLADQLRMVARLIRGRAELGVRRQVFFVALGGFDTHDKLSDRHPLLLAKLSQALAAFQRQMQALGVAGQVTAFTASDFGRTLSSNGDGSDHGWGGHQFVLGGAVRGGRFYGAAPPLSVGDTAADRDQWHVGQGRLLPTASVDQYAATLARWFGVPDAELDGLLPNLRNFGVDAHGLAYPRDLGFMG
ncbi:DUF1501 domain-containing protein [Lysobacter enzymogenes]|uniref:DUF1501 domain-containing protein n=1 Tax=Lysobacter enzymogenes TaxID=69 RepID=UPI00384A7313